MRRRGFLKLLAATLIGAGVTVATVATVFAPETERGENPGKMSVATALQKVAKRYKAGDKMATMAALLIIAEAHRDFTLVWAGGGVEYWLYLCGPSCLPRLVKTARSNRGDSRIGSFLKALKKVLLSDDSESESVRFLHECKAAFAEMAKISLREAYEHDHVGIARFKKFWPEIYAQDFPEKLI